MNIITLKRATMRLPQMDQKSVFYQRPRREECLIAHFMSEKNSRAVKHKTVEEIWYFLEGEGELWRKSSKTECVVKMEPNSALTIPVGCHFQFRNIGNVPLDF